MGATLRPPHHPSDGFRCRISSSFLSFRSLFMAANSSTCFARSGLLPFCPVFAPGSETCQNAIWNCPGITVLHNHQVFPEQPDVFLLPLHVPKQLLCLPRLLLQRLVLNFKSIILLRNWWVLKAIFDGSLSIAACNNLLCVPDHLQ